MCQNGTLVAHWRNPPTMPALPPFPHRIPSTSPPYPLPTERGGKVGIRRGYRTLSVPLRHSFGTVLGVRDVRKQAGMAHLWMKPFSLTFGRVRVQSLRLKV